jgi:hypothetical protein
MQTANEILMGILGVVGSIERNQKKEQKEKSKAASGVKDIINISSALSSFARVKPKDRKEFLDFSKDLLSIVKESNKGKDFTTFSEGLINVSNALPNLANGLIQLGNLKAKKVDAALNSLQKLYNLMNDMGDDRSARRVQKASKLFDELGKSLDRIAKPMRTLSTFLAYIGLSFVVFAGGLVAASMLLQTASPMGVVGVLLGTVTVLVGIIASLSFANKFLNKGIDTISGIGKGFGMLALGILGFTFGLLSVASFIGSGSGMNGIGKAMLVLGGVILLTVGMFALLGAADKYVKKGTDTIKGMGLGLFILIGGVFLFTLGLIGVASLLSLSGDVKGVALAMGAMALTIGALVGVFYLLGRANKQVIKGTLTALLVSAGIAVIGYSVLFLAQTAKQITDLGKDVEGKEYSGPLGNLMAAVGPGLGLIGISFIAAAGLFMLVGNFAGQIALGTATSMLVAAGLAVVGFSVKFLAETARDITNLGTADDGGKGDRKGMFGQMMSSMGPGLGMIGLIFAGAVGMFALLGVPVVAGLVALGAGTAILISGALYTLAVSVGKLVEVSDKLPRDLGDKIGFMIKSVLDGMIQGMNSLTEGKGGLKGLKNFVKNSSKIFAVTGILMTASISLSMFARALTAFANLSEMRPIIGTKENGEPIFGDKVDVRNVGENISSTISDFLINLISSTEGLTVSQARAIKKMGKALTGKRGILAGVIQFADALKVYAEFGENNEIGYIDYDDEGNEIRKKVKATTVVQNMIDSFLFFTSSLFSRSEEEFGNGEPGISGRQKRRMKRMSKALTGKHGILGAVMQFAETLKVFAEMGAGNKLPVFETDENGNQVIKEYVSVGDIANNIVKTLTSFSDTIADKLEKGKAKDASKALKKYDKMIERLNKLSTSMDGLSKMSMTVKELATNIGLLNQNMMDLDVSKLAQVSDIGSTYMKKTNDYSVSNQRIMASSNPETAISSPSPTTNTRAGSPRPSNNRANNQTTYKEPDWNLISAQIGEAVGTQIMNAFKAGQIKFEFSGNSNQGILEFE